ncbi:scabin-related ADP-ribosyltransferase, partial [Saccharopolyspora shandongensis]|uniref:scabin-related ADP-ribosyltransferase n=1 Tax=Saccharopolyspora shandongensis TaxID=418495 RepID=UPI0034049A3F
MAIMVPEAVGNLFLVLTGEKWPQINEDQLLVLAQAWRNASNRMRNDLRPEVVRAVAKIRSEFRGKAAMRFADRMAPLVESPGYLDDVMQGFEGTADFLQQMSVQTEYVKLVTILSLIELLVEMAWAIAMSGPTFGGSMAWLAGRFAIVRFLLKRLWGRLLLRIVQAQLFGIAFQVAIDAVAQGIQMAKGSRHQWDTKATVQAVGVGAMGGLLSLPLSALGGLLGNMLSKGLVKVLGNDVDKKILKAAAEAAAKKYAAELPKLPPLAKLAAQITDHMETHVGRDLGAHGMGKYAGMSLKGMWADKFGKGLAEVIEEGLHEFLTEGTYSAAIGQGFQANGFSFTAGMSAGLSSNFGSLIGAGIHGNLKPPQGENPFLAEKNGLTGGGKPGGSGGDASSIGSGSGAGGSTTTGNGGSAPPSNGDAPGTGPGSNPSVSTPESSVPAGGNNGNTNAGNTDPGTGQQVSASSGGNSASSQQGPAGAQGGNGNASQTSASTNSGSTNTNAPTSASNSQAGPSGANANQTTTGFESQSDIAGQSQTQSQSQSQDHGPGDTSTTNLSPNGQDQGSSSTTHSESTADDRSSVNGGSAQQLPASSQAGAVSQQQPGATGAGPQSGGTTSTPAAGTTSTPAAGNTNAGSNTSSTTSSGAAAQSSTAPAQSGQAKPQDSTTSSTTTGKTGSARPADVQVTATTKTPSAPVPQTTQAPERAEAVAHAGSPVAKSKTNQESPQDAQAESVDELPGTEESADALDLVLDEVGRETQSPDRESLADSGYESGPEDRSGRDPSADASLIADSRARLREKAAKARNSLAKLGENEHREVTAKARSITNGESNWPTYISEPTVEQAAHLELLNDIATLVAQSLRSNGDEGAARELAHDLAVQHGVRRTRGLLGGTPSDLEVADEQQAVAGPSNWAGSYDSAAWPGEFEFAANRASIARELGVPAGRLTRLAAEPEVQQAVRERVAAGLDRRDAWTDVLRARLIDSTLSSRGVPDNLTGPDRSLTGLASWVMDPGSSVPGLAEDVDAPHEDSQPSDGAPMHAEAPSQPSPEPSGEPLVGDATTVAPSDVVAETPEQTVIEVDARKLELLRRVPGFDEATLAALVQEFVPNGRFRADDLADLNLFTRDLGRYIKQAGIEDVARLRDVAPEARSNLGDVLDSAISWMRGWQDPGEAARRVVEGFTATDEDGVFYRSLWTDSQLGAVGFAAMPFLAEHDLIDYMVDGGTSTMEILAAYQAASRALGEEVFRNIHPPFPHRQAATMLVEALANNGLRRFPRAPESVTVVRATNSMDWLAFARRGKEMSLPEAVFASPNDAAGTVEFRPAAVSGLSSARLLPDGGIGFPAGTRFRVISKNDDGTVLEEVPTESAANVPETSQHSPSQDHAQQSDGAEGPVVQTEEDPFALPDTVFNDGTELHVDETTFASAHGAPIFRRGVQSGYFLRAANGNQVLLVDRLGAAHLGTWRGEIDGRAMLVFQHWNENGNYYFRRLEYDMATGEVDLTNGKVQAFDPGTRDPASGFPGSVRSAITLDEDRPRRVGNVHLSYATWERWNPPGLQNGQIVQGSSDGRWLRTASSDGTVEIVALGVREDINVKAKVFGDEYFWSGPDSLVRTRIGEMHPIDPGITGFSGHPWMGNQPPAAVVHAPVEDIVPHPLVIDEPMLVYRIDKHSPDQVLSDKRVSDSGGANWRPGFPPRNPGNKAEDGHNVSLVEYVEKNTDSMFVSTTRSSYFRKASGPWQYWIFAPGGISVNHTLGPATTMHREREIAFAGGVREQYIIGVRYTGDAEITVGDGTYQPDDFMLNSNAFAGLPDYPPKAASELIAAEVQSYIQQRTLDGETSVVDQARLASFNEPIERALRSGSTTAFNRVLAQLRAAIAGNDSAAADPSTRSDSGETDDDTSPSSQQGTPDETGTQSPVQSTDEHAQSDDDTSSESDDESDVLRGTDEHGGDVFFKPSLVQVRTLTNSNNEAVGVTFFSDADQVENIQTWAEVGGGTLESDHFFTYPLSFANFRSQLSGLQQLEDLAGFEISVPWEGLPEAPFIVNAHADPGSMAVTLFDGRQVSVDGATFAEILVRSAAFVLAHPTSGPGSYLLVACDSGQLTERGGGAYDFQQALVRLGRGGVVFAATQVVGTDVVVEPQRAAHLPPRPYTVVPNRGWWNAFGAQETSATGDTDAGNDDPSEGPSDESGHAEDSDVQGNDTSDQGGHSGRNTPAAESADGTSSSAQQPDLDSDGFTGTDRAGRQISFTAGQVQARTLTNRNNEVVGVIFRTGEDADDGQAWAEAGGGTVGVDHLYRYPESLDDFIGDLFEQDLDSLAEYEDSVPWARIPKSPFVVSAHADPRSMLVTLLDGREVSVDGATFAGILLQTAAFVQAHPTSGPGSYLLVACAAGLIAGQGGAAFDFQQALANLGRPGGVFAATEVIGTGVDPRDESEPPKSFTVLPYGAQWNEFGAPVVDQAGDLHAEGVHAEGPDSQEHDANDRSSNESDDESGRDTATGLEADVAAETSAIPGYERSRADLAHEVDAARKRLGKLAEGKFDELTTRAQQITVGATGWPLYIGEPTPAQAARMALINDIVVLVTDSLHTSGADAATNRARALAAEHGLQGHRGLPGGTKPDAEVLELAPVGSSSAAAVVVETSFVVDDEASHNTELEAIDHRVDAPLPAELVRDGVVSQQSRLLPSAGVWSPTEAGEQLVGSILADLGLTSDQQAGLREQLVDYARARGEAGLLQTLSNGRTFQVTTADGPKSLFLRFDRTEVTPVELDQATLQNTPVQRSKQETAPRQHFSSGLSRSGGFTAIAGFFYVATSAPLLHLRVLPFVSASGSRSSTSADKRWAVREHTAKLGARDKVFDVKFQVRWQLGDQSGSARFAPAVRLAYPATMVAQVGAVPDLPLPQTVSTSDESSAEATERQLPSLPHEVQQLISNVETYTNVGGLQRNILDNLPEWVGEHAGLSRDISSSVDAALLEEETAEGLVNGVGITHRAVNPKLLSRPGRGWSNVPEVSVFVESKLKGFERVGDIREDVGTGEIWRTTKSGRLAKNVSSGVEGGLRARWLPKVGTGSVDGNQGIPVRLGPEGQISAKSKRQEGYEESAGGSKKDKSIEHEGAQRYRLDVSLAAEITARQGGWKQPEAVHVEPSDGAVYVWVRRSDMAAFEAALKHALDAENPPLVPFRPREGSLDTDVREQVKAVLDGDGMFTSLDRMRGEIDLRDTARQHVRERLTAAGVDLSELDWADVDKQLGGLAPHRLLNRLDAISGRDPRPYRFVVGAGGRTFTFDVKAELGDVTARDQLANDVSFSATRSRSTGWQTRLSGAFGRGARASFWARTTARATGYGAYTYLGGVVGVGGRREDSASDGSGGNADSGTRLKYSGKADLVSRAVDFRLSVTETAPKSWSDALPDALLRRLREGRPRPAELTVPAEVQYRVARFLLDGAEPGQWRPAEPVQADGRAFDEDASVDMRDAAVVSVADVFEEVNKAFREVQVSAARSAKDGRYERARLRAVNAFDSVIGAVAGLPGKLGGRSAAERDGAPAGTGGQAPGRRDHGPKFVMDLDPEWWQTRLAGMFHGTQVLDRGGRKGTLFDRMQRGGIEMRVHNERRVSTVEGGAEWENTTTSGSSVSHGPGKGVSGEATAQFLYGVGDASLGVGAQSSSGHDDSLTASTKVSTSRKTNLALYTGDLVVRVRADAWQQFLGQPNRKWAAISPYPNGASSEFVELVIRDGVRYVRPDTGPAGTRDSSGPPVSSERLPDDLPLVTDLGQGLDKNVAVAGFTVDQQRTPGSQRLSDRAIQALAHAAPELFPGWDPRSGEPAPLFDATRMLRQLDSEANLRQVLNGGWRRNLFRAQWFGTNYYTFTVRAKQAPGPVEVLHRQGGGATSGYVEVTGSRGVGQNSSRSAGAAFGFSTTPEVPGSGTGLPDDMVQIPGGWGTRSTEGGISQSNETGDYRQDRTEIGQQASVRAPVELEFVVHKHKVPPLLLSTITEGGFGPSAYLNPGRREITIPAELKTVCGTVDLTTPEHLLERHLESTGPGPQREITEAARTARSFQLAKARRDEQLVTGVVEAIAAARSNPGLVRRWFGPGTPNRAKIEELFSPEMLVANLGNGRQLIGEDGYTTEFQIQDRFLSTDYKVQIRPRLTDPRFQHEWTASGHREAHGQNRSENNAEVHDRSGNMGMGFGVFSGNASAYGSHETGMGHGDSMSGGMSNTTQREHYTETGEVTWRRYSATTKFDVVISSKRRFSSEWSEHRLAGENALTGPKVEFDVKQEEAAPFDAAARPNDSGHSGPRVVFEVEV